MQAAPRDPAPPAMPARPRVERAGAPVPAVARAMALLDLLARQREPFHLSELASRLCLPKSSVHGLCSTLASQGYLRRYHDGSFFIGPAVMALANAFVGRTDAAQEFAALWQELAHRPAETVILSVLADTDVVYVAARNGDLPLGLAFTAGMRLPAHLAASGRAMLAFRDDTLVREMYRGVRLPRLSGRPAMTLKALLDELAATRERGYSVDDEGIREGVYCLGAPVFDASGQPIAGLGMCVHKAALDRRSEQRHIAAITELANQLTQRLGGKPPAAVARRR